jgi:hypothetical protein
MASGNHVCNPTCADFPTAPINKNKETTSTTFSGHKPTSAARTEKSLLCNTTIAIEIPDNKNKSPTLFTKKAFVAALPACARVYQNPINKYEHKPTPSHPKNSTNKLLEETNNSIKNVNNDRYDINRDTLASVYI